MRSFFVWLAVMLAFPALAAERAFDFGACPPDQTPPGFRSVVAGTGKPGEWKVIQDEVPPLLAPLSSKAPSVTRRAVLAQLARDPINNHFPMLIFDDETYGDFTLTTRAKTMSGAIGQMAGLVFRYQNETNYYVLFVSSLDNRFRFYKVVNGVFGPLIGPSVPIAKGEWREVSVKCAGNRIECRLDGQELIPAMTDSTFSKGKVGFWTKSDTVAYFEDTRISYTTREILAQILVRDAFGEYPRLLSLKIFAVRPGRKEPSIVASIDEQEIGQPGGKTEEDVISHGRSYYGREKKSASVTAPLRDRNGIPVAAVRVVLKTFPGQTQDNVLARAQPVVQKIQGRVLSLEDLLR
jgi:3-keto-disaccharide hydrolase